MLLVEARKNSIRIHGNGVFDFVLSTTERQPARLGWKKVHCFTALFWTWHNYLGKFSLSTLLTKLYNGELIIKKGARYISAQFNRREWLWCPINMIW